MLSQAYGQTGAVGLAPWVPQAFVVPQYGSLQPVGVYARADMPFTISDEYGAGSVV